MSKKEIPDSAIEVVARHINARSNKPYQIPIVGIPENIETPQYFEIYPFDLIDNSDRRFYAIDGSYNSQEFYNGLAIAIYTAGYICYHQGKQIRMNSNNDPVILGQAYYPENILVTNEELLEVMYDELLVLPPVKNLLDFWGNDDLEQIFPWKKDQICSNLSTLLGFCQEILEIALILEVANLPETKSGDFILRDGNLRPLQVKQSYMAKLGKYLHEKEVIIVAITKQSPIKMELSYTFKKIDNYLQDDLKYKYPFTQIEPSRRKICCWFEVSDDVLKASYKGDFIIRKAVKSGRGFGLYMVARLDYVEKLQNYDWIVADVNIFDAIPDIENGGTTRNQDFLNLIFKELTRLTQEHYILGYPYPLAEVHNFISLKSNFKEEIVNRLKYSLYKDQQMDHVDIENLFLDTHDRF